MECQHSFKTLKTLQSDIGLVKLVECIKCKRKFWSTQVQTGGRTYLKEVHRTYNPLE